MNFRNELDIRTKKAESIVKGYMPEEKGYAAPVISAMNYSVEAGGKRLRPLLMMESHILTGGSGKLIGPFMAAIEMIHSYSLVHDDLPAMDNDELRRGRPSTWKQYDEGMAVLAGDALLNFSMETALRAFELAEDEAQWARVVLAMRVLFNNSGIQGMIGGQCADLEAEKKGKEADAKELLFIHENKTAALIEAALIIGGILAGADEETCSLLGRAGYDIGIAFQIQDDILDVTGTDEELGKPKGSDERNSKATYVSIHGLDKAKEEVERLSTEAVTILSSIGEGNEFLTELVLSLIGRKK